MAHWTFDEKDREVAPDLSEHGNSARLHGPVRVEQGAGQPRGLWREPWVIRP